MMTFFYCEIIVFDASSETLFHTGLHLSTLSLLISFNNTLMYFIPHNVILLNRIRVSEETNPSYDSFVLFFGTTDRVVIRKQCPALSQLHHGYSLKVIGSGGVVESVEFYCNNSYILTGNSRITCRLDGTWSGREPRCIRGICLFDISQYYVSFSLTKPKQSCSNGCVAACREPKISKLVHQKVLEPQISLRYTHALVFGLFLF